MTIPDDFEGAASGPLTAQFHGKALYMNASYKIDEALMHAEASGQIIGFRRLSVPLYTDTDFFDEDDGRRRMLYEIARLKDGGQVSQYVLLAHIPEDGIRVATLEADFDQGLPFTGDRPSKEQLMVLHQAAGQLLDQVDISELEKIDTLEGEAFSAFMQELDEFIGAWAVNDNGVQQALRPPR